VFQSTVRLLTVSALAAALAALAFAQAAPSHIDAGHSYASLWMGRETEDTPMVNVGVAQVGGNVTLNTQNPAASSLEFSLVPGGAGADLLAPDGTLRANVVAQLVRYTAMSFRSTSSRVRRDGRLEFTGDLAVIHVTRESIPDAWNSANSFPSYTDPETSRVTRNVTFALATPRAEVLAAYLKKSSDLVATATIDAAAFPELPGVVLDSFWPTVAEDEQCEPVNPWPNARDYGGWACKGKAITTTASLQRAQTSSLDYSGLRKFDAPTRGPLTILLHLKLAPPAPPAPTPPGN
jgi:polyisoprenoid-binding protein YceI